MRKRLVIAAACILALPLLLSTSESGQATNSTAFSTVALGGHSTVGNWCGCGTQDCICDPGEQPGGNGMTRTSKALSNREGGVQGSAPDVDLASGVLTLALFLLFYLRMR